ncbi:MAG: alpha-D-ribose 1-methylphosphonate 5-triphosphate diphosphatase [Thalassobaculales bacterium]
MTDFALVNGRFLGPDGAIRDGSLAVRGGRLAADAAGLPAIDCAGMLVLPGLVDLHGDAFERQIMPRPGVAFPLDLAILETDRQLAANGITTAYYGLTYSWEPGLRGREAAHAFVAALRRVRPRLATDARLHLRWETYNLDGVADVEAWLAEGAIDLLAFNDHMGHIAGRVNKPEKMAEYAGRSGMTIDAFRALMAAVEARGGEVPAAIARLAQAARAHGVPMASHDDETPAIRARFAALGSTICEFPLNRETAREGLKDDGAVILGAPNVVRGGSHTNGMRAAEAAAEGLVSVLTSDYYFPSLLQAPFRLAAEGRLPLPAAWALVSANPARAAGLADRGVIAPGRRADLVVVDDSDPNLPAIAATYVAGRTAYRTEAVRAAA